MNHSNDVLILPIIKRANPELSFHQDLLISKIKQYLVAKKADDTKLPFANHEGICAGINSYWLYLKRIGEEGKFIHQMEYILNWDADLFKASKRPTDRIFEKFMNNVLFLNHDNELRSKQGIQRHDLAESFNYLLGKNEEQVEDAEYSLTFVFNKDKLELLINDCVHPNKMVRFGNGFHTVGMIYSGGVYYFLNPSSKEGPRAINTASELAKALFGALGPFCKSKTYLALNMSIFDLKGETPGIYKPAQEYYREQLQDSKYRQAVFAHPNLLRLGLRYDDKMLDQLRAQGYKYTPAKIYTITELGNVVLDEDEDKLKHLLTLGMPLDFKSTHGETALGTAIRSKRGNMLYLLLQQGADPNVQPVSKSSALESALIWHNAEALIILLAVGAEFNDKFLKKLAMKYNSADIAAIKAHALELNAKLLHLEEDHSFASFVQHSHLQLKLGFVPDKINMHNIDAIVMQITSGTLNPHNDADFLKIAGIIDQLTELSTVNFCLNPRKMANSAKALAAKEKIIVYLERNNISARQLPVDAPNLLLFSDALTRQNAVRELEYQSDVMPLLSLRM